MKKILLNKVTKIIAITLAMAITVSNINVSVYADSGEYAQNHYEQEEYGITFDELIDELDDDVEVVNGQFVLEISQKEIDKIGQENYEAILAGMEQVNDLLQTEEYDVTDNGTVYEINEDLAIQGGNVDKVVVKWWGIKRYASKKSAKKIVSTFNTISNSAWMVSGGTASYTAAAALAPEGLISKGSAAVSALISGLSAVGAGYFGLIATRIDAKNGSIGVIINFTWVGIFTVKKQ